MAQETRGSIVGSIERRTSIGFFGWPAPCGSAQTQVKLLEFRILRKSSAAQPSREGFTLLEMLLVIFVTAAVVSLLVGIHKVLYTQGLTRQTQVWQKMIISACDAYCTVKEHNPTEISSDDSAPPYTFGPDSDAHRRQDNWNAVRRSQNLYKQLHDVKEADDWLSKLPNEALTDLPVTTSGNARTFIDSWGQYMDFRRVGSRCLIVSPGPDGRFGDGLNETGYSKDNIRSDLQ